MINGLLGRKIGMTQVFAPDGRIIPVTVIEAGPCFVTQIRTPEKDGYQAVQIGFGAAKKLTKPARGHLGKLPPLRFLREFRATDLSAVEVGQRIDASLFAIGEMVDVIGTSKGKGFAGVIKR